MTTKEITQRNYIATVRRGQITSETTAKQFIKKLQEELQELIDSLSDDVTAPFDIKELADIGLVCDTMANHFGYDLKEEKELKMLFNEKRK